MHRMMEGQSFGYQTPSLMMGQMYTKITKLTMGKMLLHILIHCKLTLFLMEITIILSIIMLLLDTIQPGDYKFLILPQLLSTLITLFREYLFLLLFIYWIKMEVFMTLIVQVSQL